MEKITTLVTSFRVLDEDGDQAWFFTTMITAAACGLLVGCFW